MVRFFIKKTFVFVLLGLFISSCSSSSGVGMRRNKAFNIAKNANFEKRLIKTSHFVLTAYSKISSPNQPVNIYIEGDGRAWVSKRRVSPNPTPKNPVSLKLASIDASPNVIYIARPCQYTDFDTDKWCDIQYWTSKRFAPEVISSFDEAIDYFKQKHDLGKINLIGFSGGANVAVLVASKRNDIKTIRTVAGNLDHKYLNNYHNVSPQYGSLNAIDVAKKVKNIPQNHFYGNKDKVIPFDMADKFISEMGQKNCAQSIEVKRASHGQNWEEKWFRLYQKPFKKCKAE